MNLQPQQPVLAGTVLIEHVSQCPRTHDEGTRSSHFRDKGVLIIALPRHSIKYFNRGVYLSARFFLASSDKITPNFFARSAAF